MASLAGIHVHDSLTDNFFSYVRLLIGGKRKVGQKLWMGDAGRAVGYCIITILLFYIFVVVSS